MSQAPSEDASPSTTPPPGRPKREGNNSLWKRARRTLGTSSLTFMEPTTRPTATTAPAIGSGPAAPSKRREQVRHAQRTHRQRTQNYIKTLESEFVRLRESETNLIQERERLQGQLDNLRTSIVLSNIPLPEGAAHIGTSSPPLRPLSDLDMPATVSYSNDALDHPRLHVNFAQRQTPSSQGTDYPTQTYPLSTPYQGHQQYTNLSQSVPDLPNDFSLNTMNLSSSCSRPGAQADAKATILIDTIEMAIDFVLALEHPCMPHISYQDPSPGDPANHMMMASTPLMAQAPEPPQFNSTWTASGAIIKELLNLSSSINLEGEITPVEAWHRLHDHPDFWKLDRGQIEKMKRELSTKVRCYGFGAVLDEDEFWHALNQSLASSAVASGAKRD